MTRDPGPGELAGLESADRIAARAMLQQVTPDLLAYFERRLASREDAADALAETLLQAWRRVDRLPAEPVQARMWLFTVAGNVLANQRRAGHRRAALADRLRGHLATAGPAAPGADIAEQVALRDAILRLPPPQRDLVTLVHWDGLTLAEASQVLNLNPSTARSRYAAARHSLRATLTTDVPCG